MNNDPFFRDGWYLLYLMGWCPFACLFSMLINYSVGGNFFTIVPILLFMLYFPFLIIRTFKQS